MKDRSMLLFTPIVLCLSAIWADSKDADVEIREKIVYSKAGDRELLLDAFVPKREGDLPAVLVVHGGAWRSGHRQQLRTYAKELAKRGMVCEFKVDTERLGAIGYSAGGHLVCLLATTGEKPNEKNGNVDTRIKAAAAGGAPTDFRSFPDNGKWAEYWMGGDLKSCPDLFRDASATAFVDKEDAPVFFFNGTVDKVVPMAWSQSCFDALKSSGVKTEMHTIEGAGHMEAARDNVALEKAFAFLEAELKIDSISSK